jgi:putative nucleotidyltransferase with HDIG domain
MEIGKILVVDDESTVRILLRAMLERQDHTVFDAESSAEALVHLHKSGPFDCVMTDLMMTGMNGLELLERMQERHPDVPVIMITGSHDIAIAMTALRRGAFDYLVKPLNREQLQVVIQRAISHRRITQQNPGYWEKLEQLVAARTDLLLKTMGDLERSYDITLEALGDALDLKDAETEGHSKRVTAYTIALARAMGYEADEIRMIARGAFLHDIGKMAIPDAILLKPGALTEDERDVMREHCTRGYQIVRKIPYLREAAEIVYAHQERYDGKGYPRGLRGDRIPFGARVFAIADTLDAITSDRPYRKASTFEEAREEILRCAGSQFDPELVEVFASLPIELWQEIRDEISAHMRRHHEAEPPLDSQITGGSNGAYASPRLVPRVA